MFKKLFGFLIIVLIVSGISFYGWWKMVISPVDLENKEEQVFVIPQGLGASEIGTRLKKKGLIKSDIAFQLVVYKEDIGEKLQAGDFRLSPSMSLFEIADNLTHGTLDIWVTIPEGLRKEEIADRIADAFAKYDAEFDAKKFLTEAEDLEGYLFPDTYLFPKDASASAIVRTLANTFELKYQSLKTTTGFNRQELTTLASIIEREAKYDKDRKLVSGILTKRLKEDWPLEVDATIQYAKANLNCDKLHLNCKSWPIVYPKDIKEITSLFNTYKNKELPPSPICNPSLSSLQAAANPKSSEYWFYLADESGKTYFSKTIEEHNEKIRKYLD